MKIPYTHYEGCPAALLRPDTLKTDPCSCKEWYEWNEPKPRNKIQAYLLGKLKELRFKEIEIEIEV